MKTTGLDLVFFAKLYSNIVAAVDGQFKIWTLQKANNILGLAGTGMGTEQFVNQRLRALRVLLHDDTICRFHGGKPHSIMDKIVGTPWDVNTPHPLPYNTIGLRVFITEWVGAAACFLNRSRTSPGVMMRFDGTVGGEPMDSDLMAPNNGVIPVWELKPTCTECNCGVLHPGLIFNGTRACADACNSLRQTSTSSIRREGFFHCTAFKGGSVRPRDLAIMARLASGTPRSNVDDNDSSDESTDTRQGARRRRANGRSAGRRKQRAGTRNKGRDGRADRGTRGGQKPPSASSRAGFSNGFKDPHRGPNDHRSKDVERPGRPRQRKFVAHWKSQKASVV